MQNHASEANASSLSATARTALWTVLVVGSSALFSMAFAFAPPFAGLAAVAGAKMGRRDALMLIVLAWLTNQAIGYFVLGYPRSFDSFGWGAAIGIAAILATVIASESRRLPGAVTGTVAAFFAAFIVYEGALYAAAAVLPSGDEAFSLPVVARIFEINGLAFVGLLALHRLAMAFGLPAPQTVDAFFGHRA